MELAQGRPPVADFILEVLNLPILSQDLIKKIVLRKQGVRNESAWNWLRIVFIGGLFYLC